MEEIMDSWKLLRTFKEVEFWKTPTRYLVCYRYGRVFKFFDSYNEGLQNLKEFYNRLARKMPHL